MVRTPDNLERLHRLFKKKQGVGTLCIPEVCQPCGGNAICDIADGRRDIKIVITPPVNRCDLDTLLEHHHTGAAEQEHIGLGR